MSIRLLILASTSLLWSCGGEVGSDSLPASTSTEMSCGWEQFGSLLTADTSSLKREQRDLSNLTTEGGNVVLYSDSAAILPRLVVLTLYGETGQATYRFFLESRRTFVVDVIRLEYERPISATNLMPMIKSVFRDVHYVCDGSPMSGAPDGSATTEDLVELARQALAR